MNDIEEVDGVMTQALNERSKIFATLLIFGPCHRKPMTDGEIVYPSAVSSVKHRSAWIFRSPMVIGVDPILKTVGRYIYNQHSRKFTLTRG
jgi:hypothetical protein